MFCAGSIHATFPLLLTHTLRCSRGVDLRRLGLPDHTKKLRSSQSQHYTLRASFVVDSYLADLPVIVTFHLFDHLEPHLLVDFDIWLVSAGLQIALPAFFVCSIRHRLEKQLSDSLSLFTGKHSDDVAEVIALRIRPNGFLKKSLIGLPDVVPLSSESPKSVKLGVLCAGSFTRHIRLLKASNALTVEDLPYLHVQPTPPPPGIHAHLPQPEPPTLHPFIPALLLAS